MSPDQWFGRGQPPTDEGIVSGDKWSLNDSKIRTALRRFLEERWAGCAETHFLEELGLCRGQVRIDLAAVNGVLHGYEIKSDRDRLTRLSSQVELYGRVVDRATIVVGTRHLRAALRLVPSWWGVLHARGVSGAISFETLRISAENLEQDPRALVELLWREEALSLLESREAAHGVRTKPRPMIWDRVCEHFELDEISAVVRDRLKLRAERSNPA